MKKRAIDLGRKPVPKRRKTKPNDRTSGSHDSQRDVSGPYFLEICERCGFTLGSHYGNDCGTWPYNYCPGNEGQENWEVGPGTSFKGSGRFDVKELRKRNREG